MIEELLAKATRLRSDAQDDRRTARKKETPRAERDEKFEAARMKFQEAIDSLERGLRTIRRQQTGYTPDVCRVLESLSQSYGSLGGTWRDAGDRERARDLYDKGNEYEEERRRNCAAKDTYNMLQRLVIRILIDPTLLEQPEMKADLNAVREEIKRTKREDSWALADLALAGFLYGDEADAVIAELDAVIADLEQRKAEATFYESAHTVVATLVEEGLGRNSPLGKRLEDFKRLLQRKGGIP
jgi:hypothetical protein